MIKTGRQSPFNPSKKRLMKGYFLDWILISSGLFLIILAISQSQGFLEKEPSVSLTTFETIAQESNKTVFIDIAGAIVNPGLYQLPINSRVNDLIVACGGVTSWANRSFLEENLNRARILKDGEKIYVPYRSDNDQFVEELSGFNIASSKVNINRADRQELMSLSGIGEKYAQEIIDYRQSVGPFNLLDDIKKVKGIGEKIFADIESKIEI